AQTKMLLVAAPSFPGKDIADVNRLAKDKPKSVSIAISAIGTPNHLGAEMLALFGDVDLVFVPYDGVSQAIPDLIANRVDLAIAALPSLLPQVNAGALKALPVTYASSGVSSLAGGSISVPESPCHANCARRRGMSANTHTTRVLPLRGFLYLKVMIGNYATNGCAWWWNSAALITP